MTALFLVLGLVFGFISLWLGPLGLIEALIVLGLVLFQVRRFPERGGAYLFGMSLLPVLILASIVSRVPACGHQAAGTQCYEPVTLVALTAYSAGGLAGAVLLGIALRRIFGAPTASPSA
jgi:hypothetical protein